MQSKVTKKLQSYDPDYYRARKSKKITCLAALIVVGAGLLFGLLMWIS